MSLLRIYAFTPTARPDRREARRRGGYAGGGLEVDYSYDGLAGLHFSRPAGLPWQGVHPGHADHGLGGPGQPGRRPDGRAVVPDYQGLTPEAVRAAIAYAAELSHERILRLPA